MTCSTFLMAVVLMFEEENTVNYETLKMHTQLHDDYLLRALQALVEAKILIVEGSGTGDSWPTTHFAWSENGSGSQGTPSPNPACCGPNTTFTLNFQFSNKRGRFKITSAPVKEQAAGREREQTAASLEEDRKAYLQALIVRIMKVRKVAKHSELIEQVISQSSERFRPNVTMIKKCIEGLIDKQYIERMPNTTDEYSYVS
ncbi:cullin-2-like [Tropilaelaps mercedesae]|uniref:Cullin-2-like n=1 Tax=Tropilaelaps mercedesae TaxID=418985 RepID=A0A1V9XCN5_9ACAR|nr:cullin-2-like [Tropilaelaps mercedesae]